MRRNIIIGVLFVVLLLGAAIYFFFLQGSETLFNSKSTDIKTGESQDNTIESAEPLIILSGKKVISPVLSLDNQSVWYFDEDGGLYRNNLDGTGEEIFGLSEPVPVWEAFWPKTGNDFIVKVKRDGASRNAFKLFDSRRLSYVDLPRQIREVAWHPDGQRIVYIWERGDEGLELKIAQSDSSSYQKITDVDYPYLLTFSPDGKFVLMRRRVTEEPTGKVLRVSLDNSQITEVLDRGRNIDVLISPDASKILFTRVDESTRLPEVWIHDLTAGTFQNLKLVTALDKAVWAHASDKFYFGLPKSVAAGDLDVSAVTSDEVYSYSLTNNSKSKAGPESLGTEVDIRQPLLDPDEKWLFFRNGRDGKLYRLELK